MALCLCWSTYPPPVPAPWKKIEQGELAFCLVLASCLYHCSKWLRASSLLVLCFNQLLCHLKAQLSISPAQLSSWELELFTMQCYPAPQSCSGTCSSQGWFNISLHVVRLFSFSFFGLNYPELLADKNPMWHQHAYIYPGHEKPTESNSANIYNRKRRNKQLIQQSFWRIRGNGIWRSFQFTGLWQEGSLFLLT